MGIRMQKKRVRTIVCSVLAFGVSLLWVLMSCNGSALAQPTLKEVVGGKEPPAKEQKAEPQKEGPERAKSRSPVDELDRGTPRTSVEGFLVAARERDYERAAKYLDLRNLPRGLSENQGAQLARQLKIVLDSALWIDLSDVSPDPIGHPEDGLPSYRDQIGHIIEAQKEKIDILLQRVPRDDGVRIWKFSSVTVAQIPSLYREYGYGYLEKFLPETFFDVRVAGLEVWLWVGVLVIVLVSYLMAYTLMAVIQGFLCRRQTTLSNQLLRLARGPGRFLLFCLIGRGLLNFINAPLWFRAALQARTLLIIGLVWTGIWVVDFALVRLTERMERQGKSSVGLILLPLGAAMKTVLVVMATLVWLDNLGFKVTTLLAGLGIGGLAVALALQRPIENLISGITLYASQPVAVGDFCRFGDKIGTVEEIGLRATKVRTLDHTVISVANVEFAGLQLENFSKRKKIWYHPQIQLRYETTPDQVRYLLVEIRKLLYSHPEVLQDPARIRFVGFGPSSLNLEIFAYVNVTDYGEFLEVAEDLNLRIMDLVVKSGAGFAFPSQTLYVERGKGPDEQLVHAAEAQVREWREQQALFLPNFPAEKIAELRGTLNYPPPGSPLSTAPS